MQKWEPTVGRAGASTTTQFLPIPLINLKDHHHIYQNFYHKMAIVRIAMFHFPTFVSKDATKPYSSPLTISICNAGHLRPTKKKKIIVIENFQPQPRLEEHIA